MVAPNKVELAPSTGQEQIESALESLQARKDTWVRLGVGQRMALLEEMRQDMLAIGDRWVAAEMTAKGISPGTFGEAEEWIFLATILRALRLLRQSLLEIRQRGRPRIAGGISHGEDGQVIAKVFPMSAWERLLYRGVSGEVRMETGVTQEAVLQSQARHYREERRTGKVALVLGAGNASILPVIDSLYKLFCEGQVVALKLNPVNAHLGPLMEEGLQALTRRGFLRLINGGAEEGTYLCQHPAVDEIHMTGSAKTFEAITFGPGAEGMRKKASRKPLLTKRFTCELGNVGPVIVVPGQWSDRDVQEQAEQIVTWFVANAGFGCVTPRVIIQHESWALRQNLNTAIERALAKVPTRKAYYPGAVELHSTFVGEHPEALLIGQANDENLPWTFITDLDAAKTDDICFRREAFCSLFSETAIRSTNIPEFIDRAVDFANSTLWGNLNATLIVHPSSLRDPQVAAAVERAIAELRYGTVLVNTGPYAGYHLLVTPWGGYPGNDIYDIQSGTGKTANLLMLEASEKSVVRGPFNKPLDPLRVTFRQAHNFCRKLAYFEADPAFRKLPGLMWTALRGQIKRRR